ncbi:hypothetical protein D3C71_1326910 [compost metagenome]
MGFKVIVQGVQRRIGLAQRCQNARRFAVLADGQIAAVAARVGDDLVGFVQCLGNVEGFLGAEPELLRADFLQRAQIERQRCNFAYPFGTELDHPGTRCAHHRRRCLLGQRLIQTAILIVANFGRCSPLRGERGAVVEHLHVDGPVSDRYEIGNEAVTIHHQAQGRRLHPTHGQHALISRLTPE